MSKLITRSLAFLFTLTLAGAASARRPPALAEAQERAASAYATCAQEGQRTAGYRGMLARVESVKPGTAATAVAASVPTHKMGSHLVLACAGGEIHQGSGYRDFPARLRAEPSTPQIAAASKLVACH